LTRATHREVARATLPEVRIRRLAAGDRAAWLRMRYSLWPTERGRHAHESAVDAFLADRSGALDAVLVADARGVGPVGFLELRVRSDAQASGSRAVPHVEGWYVEPGYRRRRIGARLLAAAERWARAAGYAQLVFTE
jgi:aminoglycoside 6'-N-acetyltransferase I